MLLPSSRRCLRWIRTLNSTQNRTCRRARDSNTEPHTCIGSSSFQRLCTTTTNESQILQHHFRHILYYYQQPLSNNTSSLSAVALEDLHCVIRAPADDGRLLAPVAAEHPLLVALEVKERSPRRPRVPHLDQVVVAAAQEQLLALSD
jgi:hypothetical protein